MSKFAATAARPAGAARVIAAARSQPYAGPTGLDLLVAAALGLVALGLTLVHLRTTSLWGDELFSVDLARQPWTIQAHTLWSPEINMTLYYLLLRLWLHLSDALGLAPNELVVRLPSVVSMALSVGVVYLLGQRFWGRVAGVVGAALYALNYMQLFMSIEARAYGLGLLLCCLSWYALLNALTATRRDTVWWSVYVVAITLAIYTHLFNGLILVAQAVALLALLRLPEWAPMVRRSGRTMVIGAVAVGILILPLAIDSAVHGSGNAWLPPATPRSIARMLWLMSSHNPVSGLLIGLAVIAALLAVWWARPLVLSRAGVAPGAIEGHDRGAIQGRRGPTVVALTWLVVPIAVSYAVSFNRHLNLHLFGDYVVFTVPALGLLAGAGVAALRPRSAQLVAGLLIVLVTLPSLRTLYNTELRQDFRAPLGWLQGQFRPGDGVVCASPSCGTAVEYYLRSALAAATLSENFPGHFSWDTHARVPFTRADLAAYAAVHRRIFLIGTTLSGDATAVQSDDALAQQWLRQHDHLVTQVTAPAYYGPTSVLLYTS